MFTCNELKNINHTYFNILHGGCYSVTLQSKNTKHYWHILHQQYPAFTSCKIYHKHNHHYHLYIRPVKKKMSNMSA